MNDVTRSLAAGGMVVLSIGAVIAGLTLRDYRDVGAMPRGLADPYGGLVASRESAEVPADKFYAQMVEKLRREYVDPIEDEQKLAAGAIRGMVASLGDPYSIFMDPKEFAAYRKSMAGVYEGIGAEMALVPRGSQPAPKKTEEGEDTGSREAAMAGIGSLPRLVVVGLTPNGPAARAGVKLGDEVQFIDQHWLIDPDAIRAFRELSTKVEQRKAPMSDLTKMRKDLRQRMEHAIMPMRARDLLMLGVSGKVTVKWKRDGQTVTTTLTREESRMPSFEVKPDGTIVLPLRTGSAEALKAALQQTTPTTIDLRNNPIGDFSELPKILAVLGPTGEYGLLANQRPGGGKPLKVENGNATAKPVTFLVDESTRGPAEILAAAMKAKGLATIKGSLPGHRRVVETFSLPDGSGYTLSVAEFKPASTLSAQAVTP